MNISKPIYITIIGSILLGVFVLTFLLISRSAGFITMDSTMLIVIPLLIIILSFVIFTLFIRSFLSKKIESIYKIISNKQITEKTPYSISDDVLTQLSKDTANWADTQNQQIKDLQKQAKFRREFLGNLAHELKTPIFSIQGYILTLLEGGLEDERVNRDFLERALSGVDRISDLLDDLDQITKYETDRFELKLIKFDIVELIKITFHELETKAKRKTIQLTFQKHYEPFYVVADQHRIAQVLANLISNSISYGINGGTTKIAIVEATEKKKILIEVSDNGLGMSADHIPRLFERFYRVDKSRERNIGGSGLGLAIVKHIIEAHQQTIAVRSTEGIGSTFSFTLDKA